MRNTSGKLFLIWASGSGDVVFKDFLPGALAALLFSGAEPFSAILKEGIIGNIHVKLFEFWTTGSGGDVV